jgi:anthranilate synthase/aminodeoxychorismate synthase-like glutamine amidotransferase
MRPGTRPKVCCGHFDRSEDSRGRNRQPFESVPLILLIDNYDSFVHNLARYIQRLGHATRVVRNDAITTDQIRALAPQAVVLSPGPCTPRQAGVSLEVVARFAESLPMLGVCLGHQAIAEALGGKVIQSVQPMHGRASLVQHDGTGVFRSCPLPMRVGRYHSLVVDPASLPPELAPTAFTSDGVLMAFEHRQLPLVGVQFHPESILTEGGYQLLSNFLHMAGLTVTPASELFSEELVTPQVIAPAWPANPLTF